MKTSKYELMRHALGVTEQWDGRWNKPYRNHFCAGGDHIEIWDGLVSDGLATRREGSAITGGDPVFYVTDAGREAALAGITFKRTWGYGTPTNA